MVILDWSSSTPGSPTKRPFSLNQPHHPPVWSSSFSDPAKNPWNSYSGLQPSADIWGPRIKQPFSSISATKGSKAIKIPQGNSESMPPVIKKTHTTIETTTPTYLVSPHSASGQVPSTYRSAGSDGRTFQRRISSVPSLRNSVSSPSSSSWIEENYMDSPPPSPEPLDRLGQENLQMLTISSSASHQASTGSLDDLRTSDKNEQSVSLNPAEELTLSTSCGPLYMVEFKGGRLEIFTTTTGTVDYKVGDQVMVDADRGRDLGRVVKANLSHHEAIYFKQMQSKDRHRVINSGHCGTENQSNNGPAVFIPKQILGVASAVEIKDMDAKIRDEASAVALCNVKVVEHGLDMKIIDAEYQWDRRKLTFFYYAESRIDFRELVRELFRIYRTRIWMCSTNAR